MKLKSRPIAYLPQANVNKQGGGAEDIGNRIESLKMHGPIFQNLVFCFI